jgi:hypothetical protein
VTVLVGIASSEGIVIGADSSATSAAPGNLKTIEKPTRKLQIISPRLLVATTGAVGLAQRFTNVLTNLWTGNHLKGNEHQWAKTIAQHSIQEFADTKAAPMSNQTGLPAIGLGALVAMVNGGKTHLAEFEVGSFQPEFKTATNWYVAMGSGQMICDPFLALLSTCFCADGKPPDLATAKFMTAWALQHACAVNPGGIKEPYHLAVLSRTTGDWAAAEVTEEEVLEHAGMIEEAYKHIGRFTEEPAAPEVPEVPTEDPPA